MGIRSPPSGPSPPIPPPGPPTTRKETLPGSLSPAEQPDNGVADDRRRGSVSSLDGLKFCLGWFDICLGRFDIYRHSGASRNLAAPLDSGLRHSDGLPAKPPKTKRCRSVRQN